MAKKTTAKKSRRASGSPPERQPGKAAAWMVGAGVVVLLTAALISYDPADAPSLSHGVTHTHAHNWVGTFGALIAHKTYLTIGPGVWVGLVGLVAALIVWARGRTIDQLPLRIIGLLLMVVATSALIGVSSVAMVAGVEAGPHAPGGLLAMLINDQMAMRFGVVGTMVILGVGFWVGALLAVDQFVLAVPRLIGGLALRARGIERPAFRLNLGRLIPSLAAFKSGPWTLGGGGTATLKPKPRSRRKRDDDFEIDEDTGGLGATESFGSPNDTDAEDTDEDEQWEYVDEDEAQGGDAQAGEDEEWEYEDEEEEAAASDTPKKFDPDELRKKMKQLPINFARQTAKKQEIPREPDLSGYQFPGIDLLDDPEGDFSDQIETIVRDQAVELESALQQYKIEGEVVGIDSGPVITLFEVRLAPGTKASRLNTIASDLARALKAQNIRIVPNTAGKDTVGVEVPNIKREMVRIKDLMQAQHAEASKMKLPMFLGKDASGNALVQDLSAMPHMLIAGTTGSGKSVCMNSIILSFLFTKRPDELKLVLVDPKMVEMSMFKSIPHLMCPVVTEMNKAAAILEWAVTKMDERYELLAEAGVRDLASYNELGEEELKERMEPSNDEEWARIPKKLPYMVFVIDELADLMMTNKEVEAHIVRIAQKARAVGLHLILATQRPQANVVTGLIKSNMPCRICMKVASGMDSRIVLDAKGGEILLGHGDMLYLSPRSAKLTRAQGCLIDDFEIRKTVKFLKTIATQNFEPSLMQVKHGGADSPSEGDDAERDPLFEQAVDIVIETRRGSVSLLQRRLTIGYSRSSRIIEQIAQAGMLGPHKGSQAREVVISKEEWDAMRAQAAADAEAGYDATDTDEDQTDGVATEETDQEVEYEYVDEEEGEEDDDGGAPSVYAASDDDGTVPDELDGEFRQ